MDWKFSIITILLWMYADIIFGSIYAGKDLGNSHNPSDREEFIMASVVATDPRTKDINIDLNKQNSTLNLSTVFAVKQLRIKEKNPAKRVNHKIKRRKGRQKKEKNKMKKGKYVLHKNQKDPWNINYNNSQMLSTSYDYGMKLISDYDINSFNQSKTLKRIKKLKRRNRVSLDDYQKKRQRKKLEHIAVKEYEGNKISPASIDFIIEKSSHYYDPNSSLTMETIGVSVENPSTVQLNAESADISFGLLEKMSPGNDINEKNHKVKENPNGIAGDLSCLVNGFRPAPEVQHADVKYIRNDNLGPERAIAEVEYICKPGYEIKMSNDMQLNNIYCKNGEWIGDLPICSPIKNITTDFGICKNNQCNQVCYVVENEEKCACHKGFRMENGRCEDVNECLQRNGHGPCQDKCINTWGSYRCTCDGVSGTRLSPDGHNCLDKDECLVKNGGCSHTCLNTMGRAFCLCPEGWMLDNDWKTCIDIDECANDSLVSELKCSLGCFNTPGSYTCLVNFETDELIEDGYTDCSKGYKRSLEMDECEDIDECLENNGDCYHDCINTLGSFYCSCREGFVLAEDKYTCIAVTESSEMSCPPLFPPKHGYLECSRPTSNEIIEGNNLLPGERKHITNHPGSQCELRCPTGYRMNGKFSKQCSISGYWIGEGTGTCIRYPMPKLICPSNIITEIPKNKKMATVQIPRPKTDVNFDKDIEVTPKWLHNTEVALEIGIRNISYTARHPVSKLFTSCSFSISVLAGKPPIVKFCPETKNYTVMQPYETMIISWKEPIFYDNVNVTEISHTNKPGNSFGVGSHQIIYIARDQAGYTARCIFKLHVNVATKPNLYHPLPIYRMFY